MHRRAPSSLTLAAGQKSRAFSAPRRVFNTPRPANSTVVQAAGTTARQALRPIATKPVSQQAPFQKAPATKVSGLNRESSFTASISRRPLVRSLATPVAVSQAADNDDVVAASRAYTCLYHKFTNAKKKKYFDGFVILLPKKKSARLVDTEGKQIAMQRTRLTNIEVDTLFSFGSWDAEVTGERDFKLFGTGQLFLTAETTAAIVPATKTFKRTLNAPSRRKANFLSRSTARTDAKRSKKALETPETPVIDNFLEKILRPHQRDGILFLWSVITGQAKNIGEGYASRHGAILADEMGLGKTLTSIALSWLLLKQYPHIDRIVVVTPASLVQNWADEFRKWLGPARLSPVVVRSKGSDAVAAVKSFVASSATVQPAIILSYEMFRKVSASLCTLQQGFLICDEGHRMKSGRNKTVMQLKKFPSAHRLIISGTPIQNNLGEFFQMIDFVNPGVLGSLATFNNIFAKVIDASRDKNASAGAKEIGDSRSAQLADMSSSFILRRNASLLTKYLPERREYAICCRLTPLQQAMYSHHLQAKDFRSKVKTCPLELISFLKKLCNHPDLVVAADDEDLDSQEVFAPATLDSKYVAGGNQLEYSGKLRVAETILRTTLSKTEDKVVIVSNYTKTLDVIASLLRRMRGDFGSAATSNGVSFFRLDGNTDTTERQSLVNRFNCNTCAVRCFLLSSKAGGVGLNLVGANRLLLFDPDWNPATDSQVMARVWRFGQTKVSHIYRLLATGTIDERIYQRQIAKNELATTVVDSKAADRNFSSSELKRLFMYDPSSTSTTAELMRLKHGNSMNKALQAWCSYDPAKFPSTVMQVVSQDPIVSYVHCTSSKIVPSADDENPVERPSALAAAKCVDDTDELELDSDGEEDTL